MSVGFEQVRWEEGKVIAFDDTFIHQVGTKSHLREEEIEDFFFRIMINAPNWCNLVSFEMGISSYVTNREYVQLRQKSLTALDLVEHLHSSPVLAIFLVHNVYILWRLSGCNTRWFTTAWSPGMSCILASMIGKYVHLASSRFCWNLIHTKPTSQSVPSHSRHSHLRLWLKKCLYSLRLQLESWIP